MHDLRESRLMSQEIQVDLGVSDKTRETEPFASED